MKKIVPFNNVLTFDTNVSEITAISLEHDIVKNEDVISGSFYVSGEYKILNGGLKVEKFNFDLPFDIALSAKYDMDSLLVDIDDFRYELVSDREMKVNIDLYIDGEEVKEEVREMKEVEIKEISSLDNEDIKNNDSLVVEDDGKKEVINDSCIEEENNCDDCIDKEEEIMEDNVMNEDNKVLETPREEVSRDSDLLKEMLSDNNEEEGKETNDNSNVNVFNSINGDENYVTYKVYRVVDGDNIDNILTKYKVTKEEILCYNENIQDIKVGDKLIIPFK